MSALTNAPQIKRIFKGTVTIISGNSEETVTIIAIPEWNPNQSTIELESSTDIEAATDSPSGVTHELLAPTSFKVKINMVSTRDIIVNWIVTEWNNGVLVTTI
jgi:hypothetical protein